MFKQFIIFTARQCHLVLSVLQNRMLQTLQNLTNTSGILYIDISHFVSLQINFLLVNVRTMKSHFCKCYKDHIAVSMFEK